MYSLGKSLIWPNLTFCLMDCDGHGCQQDRAVRWKSWGRVSDYWILHTLSVIVKGTVAHRTELTEGASEWLSQSVCDPGCHGNVERCFTGLYLAMLLLKNTLFVPQSDIWQPLYKDISSCRLTCVICHHDNQVDLEDSSSCKQEKASVKSAAMVMQLMVLPNNYFQMYFQNEQSNYITRRYSQS